MSSYCLQEAMRANRKKGGWEKSLLGAGGEELIVSRPLQLVNAKHSKTLYIHYWNVQVNIYLQSWAISYIQKCIP